MLFWCFSVGLQKYKPLLSPRNLNAYRVSISADVVASVFLFTPSLIYRNLAGHRRSISKEIREAGFSVRRQVRIPVFYKGVELRKDFYADMVVNDCILLELKAVSSLNQAHERQLVSYLRSTGIKEGMLLNFGNVRRLEWLAVQ